MHCRANMPSVKVVGLQVSGSPSVLLAALHRDGTGVLSQQSRTHFAQVDGRAVTGPDLSVTHFSGLKLPNPFVIGSGVHPLPISP